MEKLKSFAELFEKKVGGEKGLIASGERFLGVFSYKILPELERYLRTDLGTYRGRFKRPFICRKEEDFYTVIFLTTKPYSKRMVNLELCNRGDKPACRNLEINCFVLRDRNRGEVLAYVVPEYRLKEFEFDFCGSCRDLEFLDSLRRERFS